MKNVKLGQAFEEGPQSSRKSKDRMEVLFFKERTLNPKEKELHVGSSKTFRPIRSRIPQTERNRSSNRQLLQQHDTSLRKEQRNRFLFTAELFAKCRSSRKDKSFRYYNECHDRLRAAFKRISQHDETLKQNNTITFVSLLNRSKRHTKSRSVKAPRKADDATGKSTAEKPLSKEKAKPAKPKDANKLKEDVKTVGPTEEQMDFMQHLKNFVLHGLTNVKDEDQLKKTEKKTDKQLEKNTKEFTTNISKVVEVKTTSKTIFRDLKGTGVDDPEPNRFSTVEVAVPKERSIVFIFRRTTTKGPCQNDDTLYALVLGFGICFGLLLLGICIAVCLIDDAPNWFEREPLIIYTKRPTEDTVIVEESVRSCDSRPRRSCCYDDQGSHHSRRERRKRRRLKRPRYIQLHATPTWPLYHQTGLNLQPLRMSECPRRIQLPTATPVAQLYADTSPPKSPVPRSEGRSKIQLPASKSATPLNENTGPPMSQAPKTESQSKNQAAAPSTPAKSLIENTGPPMSQAPKTESQSNSNEAASSTPATPLIENTVPSMSQAPTTEGPSKIQVSTSAIPLYENTGPPKSSTSISKSLSKIQLTTSTSATPLHVNTTRQEPPVPK